MWAAFDEERGHELALKTFQSPGPAALLRLKQEFRAFAGVTHENLLALHDLVVDDASSFFTMELVEGVDVVRFIRGDETDGSMEPTEVGAGDTGAAVTRRGETLGGDLGTAAGGPGDERTASEPAKAARRRDARFDETRLRSAYAQLVAALSALHARGLSHRDLKPSNVLVTPDGVVRVLDYGLLTGELDIGVFEGTAAYAAPEQALGRCGPAVDAYALGVVLFEAITGTLPFDGSPLQMLVDKRQREAPRASSLVDGVAPDLDDLVAALLARDPARRPTLTGAVANEPSLLGRDQELLRLERALGGDTRGSTVVVEGASGIGKTALCRAFLARARAAGAVVLEGRCNPREAVPYNAFDGVIDALARHLAREGRAPPGGALATLFPVLGRAEEGDLRIDADAQKRSAVEELSRLLSSIPDLVVFIDDYQWADRDSQALLLALSRTPARFLLTQRGGSHPPPWAAESIALGPLSTTAARAMLADARSSDVDSLLRIAEGHPLFLEELARASTPPHDLESAIAGRVGALDPEALALMKAACLAAAPLHAHWLAAAAGLEVASTLRAIDRLAAERLLRLTDRGAEPFHDRVRDAVLSLLSPEEQRALHRTLWSVLERKGDPRMLVHHLAGAGALAEAREAALAAARRAEAALAFEQASMLLRDAIAYGATGDDVLRRLADALANAHRGAEAAEVYLRVEGEARVRARTRAAELLLSSGEIARGRAVVSALLAEGGSPLPRSAGAALAALVGERVSLSVRGFSPRRGAYDAKAAARADLFRSVAQGLGMADNVRAALYNTRALRAALEVGDPARAAVALATESIFRGSVDVRKPRDLLALARALADETGDETARAWVSGADATLDALGLVHPGVVEGLLRAESYFEQRTRGNTWALDSLKLVRALSQLLLGQIEALRARIPQDLADAQRRGDRYLETTLQRGSVRIMLCDGDVARARDALDRSRWTSFRDGFHIQHWLELEGRAEIALYEGDARHVLHRHGDEFFALRTSLIARLQRPRILARATRGKLLLARGDRASLLECAWLVRQLLAERIDYATVRALLLRATVSARRGLEALAIADLRETVRIAERGGLASIAAAARRRLAARVGGDEGRALRASSDAWMAAERIAEPDRIADLEAPFL